MLRWRRRRERSSGKTPIPSRRWRHSRRRRPNRRAQPARDERSTHRRGLRPPLRRVRDAFATNLVGARRRGRRGRDRARRPAWWSISGAAGRTGAARGRGGATRWSTSSRSARRSRAVRDCAWSSAGLRRPRRARGAVLARVRGRRPGGDHAAPGAVAQAGLPADARSRCPTARCSTGRGCGCARAPAAVVDARHRARLPRQHLRLAGRRGGAARRRARRSGRCCGPRSPGRSAPTCTSACRVPSTDASRVTSVAGGTQPPGRRRAVGRRPHAVEHLLQPAGHLGRGVGEHRGVARGGAAVDQRPRHGPRRRARLRGAGGGRCDRRRRGSSTRDLQAAVAEQSGGLDRISKRPSRFGLGLPAHAARASARAQPRRLRALRRRRLAGLLRPRGRGRVRLRDERPGPAVAEPAQPRADRRGVRLFISIRGPCAAGAAAPRGAAPMPPDPRAGPAPAGDVAHRLFPARASVE